MKLIPANARRQIARRYRQMRTLVRMREGRGLRSRARAAVAQWLAPASPMTHVRDLDVLDADLTQPFVPENLAVVLGEPIFVNWVMTPPAPGSGGHTTIFRILRYLEGHGYVNRVYFYDVYGGDHTYYEEIVRTYYMFLGPVAKIDDGMADAHSVIATGWPTAYPVYNSRCRGKRFYFVQDFEPYFYPVGSTSVLAENTYRMGFHGISIGRCFVDKLRSEFGMEVDAFQYGCDISQYRVVPGAARFGVVFYARRENARRGCELGIMALALFARKRPDLAIHIYGDHLGKLPFTYVDHGRVTPVELNKIYNSCYAGLCLSFTNVTLVALEMLAAGCIPVVNDTTHIRLDLENAFVQHAASNPAALACALEKTVASQELASTSFAAATSVQATTWEEAGQTVDRILRDSLRADAIASTKNSAAWSIGQH